MTLLTPVNLLFSILSVIIITIWRNDKPININLDKNVEKVFKLSKTLFYKTPFMGVFKSFNGTPGMVFTTVFIV